MTFRTKSLFAIVALIVLATLLTTHEHAFAGSPFGVGTPETRGVAFTGPFGAFFAWVAMRQTEFYKLLTGALHELKTSNHAVWLLGGVSFLYGVFHAAGPGHGKAVITSYLLVSRQTMRRGVIIAFAAALMQGLVAIALVLIAVVLLKATSIGITKATDWFEIISYGFVTAVGAWLLWTKATGRGHSHQHAHAVPGSGRPAHSEHHHREHGHAHTQAGHDHPHEHCHEHDHDHAHAPDPKLLASGLTVSRAWSAILAVGIRPCSGAIIILVFAMSQHLLAAGMASVMAMSLGTAITVSSLVILAVSAKDLALRYAGADSLTTERVVHGLEIIAALFVLLLGLTLLGGAVSGGLP